MKDLFPVGRLGRELTFRCFWLGFWIGTAQENVPLLNEDRNLQVEYGVLIRKKLLGPGETKKVAALTNKKKKRWWTEQWEKPFPLLIIT